MAGLTGYTPDKTKTARAGWAWPLVSNPPKPVMNIPSQTGEVITLEGRNIPEERIKKDPPRLSVWQRSEGVADLKPSRPPKRRATVCFTFKGFSRMIMGCQTL